MKILSRFVLTGFMLFSLMAVPALAQDGIDTAAKQAIIIDTQTGTVLLNKNADDQMPTSSMSKVMTMYMVFDALKEGGIKLDDTLPVSEKAWRIQGSKMFVELNNRIKVEDLIRGVIIQSGNDATVVFAEGLAGSEEAFAAAATEKAKELGMKNSNFVNASGWPDPSHYSTARDLAILGQAMIENFPAYYKYYSEKEFTYHDIKQGNRNPLLYRNMGADGIKTGHTEDGGYGLMGSGVRDGRRVVMVINGLPSSKARAEESARLLEWGLSRFENKTLIKAGQVLENADVAFGKSKSVGMTLKDDILLTLPKMTGNKDMKVNVKYKGPLIAPIAKGDKVGTVQIALPGVDPISKPIYAAEDVGELGLFAKTMQKAKFMIMGKES